MIHVATSIEGLERLSDKELQEIAPHMMVNGEPLKTANQVREALKKAREEGLKLFLLPSVITMIRLEDVLDIKIFEMAMYHT